MSSGACQAVICWVAAANRVLDIQLDKVQGRAPVVLSGRGLQEVKTIVILAH